MAKGVGRVARTQADGSYVIAAVAAGTDTVRVRLIGYAPAFRAITVTAGQATVADFAISTQAIGLTEIVVTGYGEQRAGDITGAVTSVSADEFNTGRVVSPAMLIQSKVAGVQVVDNNEPGGGLSVRIRGTTSVNASSEPLYVVDGMPLGTGAGGGLSAGRDPLNSINPDDIESITVLRDASSAAIYGANAANGVIIIQTRTGHRGAPQVSYSTSVSASSVTRLPSMLNAQQFTAAVTQYGPASNVSQLQTQNTDWFSQIDRTAYGQEHNLSVAGVGQTSNYRLSLGYLNQDGIIRGTTTERLSLGVNYTQRFYNDRLTVRTNLRGSRALDRFTPGGVLSNAAQFGPTQPVTDATSPTGYYDWPGNTLQSPDNPVAILALATDRGTTFRAIGNAQVEYHMPFLRALTANVNLGFDVTEATRETFTASALHSQKKTGNGGAIYRTTPHQVNTIMDTYLHYAAPLGLARATIDLTGGYSYSQSNADYSFLQASGLVNDLSGANGYKGASVINPIADPQNSKLISFFGRASYNINDRYLASVSVRRDGSSRFGPNNAWGTFPSVALAWRISGERFMENFRSLSELKLRASWARTGNQAFANYQQYANYVVGDGATQAQFGNVFVPTIRPSAVDPDIKWEATSSYNVGLDYGFSGQRFSGTIDFYSKKTTDMIFTVPVAAGTNFSNFLTTNIGSMRNKGIELSLAARVLQGGRTGLSWTANFTASHNSNELLTINPFGGAVQQILVGGVAGGVGTTIQVLEPGQPVNSFYTCRQAYTAGKPDQGMYHRTIAATSTTAARDTVVSGCLNADRVANHSPQPNWIVGHSSYMTYGNFDAGFTVRAYLGSYVYNNVASNLGTYSEVTRASPFNLHSSVLETGFTTPQYLSDYYVESASFLRVDNITVGYTFNFRRQPLRAYLTVQNAFTITGYSGVDPTAGLNGIDNNIYPRSRTVTGGMSVRF
jgi:iron complex outermembrane receptor protein